MEQKDFKHGLRWIPLSEQLPPVGKDVVFARYEYNDYGRTGTGFITDEGKPPYLYNIRHLWEPTHWCDCLPDAVHSTKKDAVAETKEPQPFTISEAMWEATQQNIASLYIQIAKLNDKIEGKA